MATAKRMNETEGLRTSLRTAFGAMWTIEGQSGIWWYVSGCKKDYVPKEGEVIAEANGATAVFKQDEVVMKIMTDALGLK